MDPIVARLLLAEDPEEAIRDDMAAAIVAARASVAPPRMPDGPLRILLVGHAGAGNIGADIRVLETARQLRAIFGRDLVLGLVTRGDATVVEGVVPETLGGYFPDAMAALIARYDALVVCEGSLFTSTFSNMLTTLLSGALGMAAALGKPAIAYGVEAGRMDAGMAAFVRAHCREATILCRSPASVARVRDTLGLRAALGADTAWTFEPDPPATARNRLIAVGWDGMAPVLALCPINPFWWPVRPDMLRAMTEAESPHRYDATLFHHHSAEADAAFAHYINALATAACTFAARIGAFPIVVGMERLDRTACAALAAALPGAVPVFASGYLDAGAMVAVLRQSALVVTSRFHAAVTAMPGGVATIGVSMDERLRNLMDDLGRPDLCLGVDDADLPDRLLAAMMAMHADLAGAADAARRLAGRQLVEQARMGRTLLATLMRRYPDLRTAVVPDDDLLDFLPALFPDQRALFDAGLAQD